jgi:type I restriction enzyme, S subunit
MDNKRKVKLKEIATINPTERLEKGTTAKYVPMSNITEFTKKISTVETKEYKGGMKFRNGDILFARITPCLENGKTAFVDFLDEDEIGFGSTEYIVIREKEGLSDKHYLFYLSVSQKFRDRAIKLMTGTSGRQRVQINAFKNLEISLPPLPEQKRIANILSSFDNKIELLREQNKTLENIAQTIFKQWFIDFNFPDSNGKPYKDNGGKMIDRELGLIPEGWEVGKLGEYLQTKLGGTPSRKNRKFWGGNIPWINSGELNKFIIIEPTEYITKSGLKNSSTKLLPRKSLVLAITGATMGKLSILGIDTCFNQSVVGIIPNQNIHTSFLYLYIKSNIKKILNSATGGAQQHVNKNVINQMLLNIPLPDILNIFHSIVDFHINKILLNYQEIQKLEKIRNNLLKHLFT